MSHCPSDANAYRHFFRCKDLGGRGSAHVYVPQKCRQKFWVENEIVGLKRSFGNKALKISGSGSQMIFGPPAIEGQVSAHALSTTKTRTLSSQSLMSKPQRCKRCTLGSYFAIQS